MKKSGFTLLEVLIVVVIAVSVAAFAVPAYKKTQEKNKYFAAQGVLLDLGTAVQALRADLEMEGSTTEFPSSFVQVLYTLQKENTTYGELKEAKSLKDISADNLKRALFARKYLAPIAFDPAPSNKVKGFYLYICPQDRASNNFCCGGSSEVVACMYNSSLGISSATKGQYYSAQFLQDGSIRRVPQTE